MSYTLYRGLGLGLHGFALCNLLSMIEVCSYFFSLDNYRSEGRIINSFMSCNFYRHDNNNNNKKYIYISIYMYRCRIYREKQVSSLGIRCLPAWPPCLAPLKVIPRLCDMLIIFLAGRDLRRRRTPASGRTCHFPQRRATRSSTACSHSLEWKIWPQDHLFASVFPPGRQ